MIVKSYEFDKSKKQNSNFFLIYGKNEGLQNEIVEKYFLQNFEGTKNKYDEYEFIRNYDEILNGILSQSLFEGNELIIISQVTDKILKNITEIINKEISQTIFLLKSDSLDKKSKIRALFEKNKNLITIPVYEDNFNTQSYIVEKFLKKNNIKLSRESVNLIINRSNGDRKNLNIELEKILNYSLSNKNIDFGNIEKLTNLSANYEFSDLVDAFLLKDIKKISKIFNENNYSNEDCIIIIRSLLSKSKRLINIIELNNTVNNIDKVISSIKPPIFWKEKESVKKQAISWKLEELKDKAYKMNDIELLVKNNNYNSLNIVSDFIINYQ